MLVEAVNWDGGRPSLSPVEVLTRPDLAHYVSGWGRPGDAAVVASGPVSRSRLRSSISAGAFGPGSDPLAPAGRSGPVGAAWYRPFPAEDPGYGFVDASVPEVSIGVVAGRRGQGEGGALLDALADRARRELSSLSPICLSLSVEVENPAVRLYRRHGYTVVSTAAGAHTMLVRLR